MAETRKFAWNELLTRDPDAARAFYTTVLGWTAQTVDMPNGAVYTMFKQGDENIAGMMPMDGPQFDGVTPQWMGYISVDDIDASVAAVKAAGGAALSDPFDVPDVGRIVAIQDPTGAVVSRIAFAPEQG